MPNNIRTPARTSRGATKKSRTMVRRKQRTMGIPTKVFVGRQAFPKQLFNTLRYVERASVAVSIGIGSYIFSCNGLFDPNITAAGHQPLYFDQLAAVYNHYTVLRSRIKVSPMADSTTMLHTIYVDDDTSIVASATIAAERPDAVSNAGNANAGRIFPLSLSWDAAKTFGPNPQAQDSLQGSASANPTEQSYFIWGVHDYAATSYNLNVLFELEFDVVWDEFATISTS